jgi:hypothetical protein
VASALTVEFVKLSDRACLARARRADGALVETAATTKGGPPHDLEHLVVEAALDCHGKPLEPYRRVTRRSQLSASRLLCTVISHSVAIW